jgi:hypothetical protein
MSVVLVVKTTKVVSKVVVDNLVDNVKGASMVVGKDGLKASSYVLFIELKFYELMYLSVVRNRQIFINDID